jgi:hypothetical protein
LDKNKRYVACYSSTDLAHWTFRNRVLQQADPGDLGPGFVVERPKVFYNVRTKEFVMYMHIDDDGSAYLIFEDRPSKGFHIAKLSDDYLDVEKDICLIRTPLAGGAAVHYKGLYYAVGSALTGWDPNPNKYATARSIAGPWPDFKDIAPPDTNTYGSQSTMLFKVVGSKTTSVIFMGDIWKPQSQWDSRYLRMPVEIGQGKMRLPEPQEFTIDLATGEAVLKGRE